jgi:hypothetical protein
MSNRLPSSRRSESQRATASAAIMPGISWALGCVIQKRYSPCTTTEGREQ